MSTVLLESNIALRHYQQELKDKIYAEIRNGKSKVLAQLPTGGGKSKLISSIIRDAVSKSKRVLVVAHREFLLEQAKFHLIDGGLPDNWMGFIKAGYPEFLELPVQICSPQTWSRRYKNWQEKPLVHQLSLALPDPGSAVLGGSVSVPFGNAVLGGLQGRKRNWKREDGLPHFDVILIDEAHHSSAATYEIFWELYPEAKIIGFTATPCRADGKGFDHLYESLVVGVSVSSLIGEGFLSEYRLVRGKVKANLKGLKVTGGEYAANDDAVGRFSTADILGDIVNTWKQFIQPLDNRRTVGFAIRCDHAKKLTVQFQEAGINAGYIDGEFSASERVEILSKFILGEIDILWQVGLFGEGFDLSTYSQRYGLPNADIVAVQIARPVRSLALARQIYGRCLRPVPNKIAYVIDHGNAHKKCGFPCDEVEWKLEGSELKEAPKKECPHCQQIIFKSLDNCPYCGFIFPKPKMSNDVMPEPHEITHDKEVEMELIDPTKMDRLNKLLEKHRGFKLLEEFIKHNPTFEQLCQAARKAKAWDTRTGSFSFYWVDPWAVWSLWENHQQDMLILPTRQQLESWRSSLYQLIKDYNSQHDVHKWRAANNKSAKCRYPVPNWASIKEQEFKIAWGRKQLKLNLGA